MPQEYQHEAPTGSFKTNLKGLLLYILPAPLIIKLVITLLSANIPKLLLTVGALFFFYSAAHMTRTTLVRLNNSKTHRREKIKDHRFLSAIYVTVGVLILMFLLRARIPSAVLMASSAFIGYYFVYGLSQQRVKATINYETIPKITRDAIKSAYQDLNEIEKLGEGLTHSADRLISEKLKQVIDQSYIIMELLVKTPEDTGRARRFLNVYINRIKEILQQYLKLSKHGKTDNLRPRLLKTLTDTEKAFREKQSKLLDDDIFKLDVQLEVLDEQIRSEY